MFEPGIVCRADEYYQYRKDRLNIEQSSLEQLISLMVLVDSADFEAAKLPARLVNKERKSGLLYVELEFLKADLTPTFTKNFPTNDNFLYATGMIINSKDRSGKAVEAYARDYFDDLMPISMGLKNVLDLEKELVLI